MDIIEITIERAEKLLKAAGVQYAIQMPDGSVLGELKIDQEKPKRVRDTSIPWGEISKKIDKYVQPLKVGQVAKIEGLVTETLTKKRVQSIASARAILHFGKGNCITHQNGDVLEVLRVA